MNRKTLKIIRQYCKIGNYDEKQAVRMYKNWDIKQKGKLIEQMKLFIKVQKNRGADIINNLPPKSNEAPEMPEPSDEAN